MWTIAFSDNIGLDFDILTPSKTILIKISLTEQKVIYLKQFAFGTFILVQILKKKNGMKQSMQVRLAEYAKRHDSRPREVAYIIPRN